MSAAALSAITLSAAALSAITLSAAALSAANASELLIVIVTGAEVAARYLEPSLALVAVTEHVPTATAETTPADVTEQIVGVEVA